MEKEDLKMIIIAVLIIATACTAYYAYTLREKYILTMANSYNKAFSEAVNCINNVENFLAKTQITKDRQYSTQALTDVWNDANMAMNYLAEIPFDSEGATNTIKFLNQVSDYSYSLARKNMNSEELNEEDFKKLEQMYLYTKDLGMVLNQLSDEIYSGNIGWKEIQDGSNTMFAQEVGNINAFSNIDSTFDEYEGLIYDGAYSEHLNRNEKKFLTEEEIKEDQAKSKIKKYLTGEIENIESSGLIKNVDIEAYSFFVKMKDVDEKYYIEITKVGGFLLQLNNSKEIIKTNISNEEANRIGKKYLKTIGFDNMKETYFTKRENILTVNYAYFNDGIIFYPDLIKVKISLEDGTILGVETRGYLNCHYDRKLESAQVSIDEVKSNLNTNLEILSEQKAVIPVETGEEKLCYEFKGKVVDKEFLVYSNVVNGKEENILIILETDGGILTI